MALHNQKWVEGSTLCPWGHPRKDCEQVYVNKMGRTKRSCRIQRSQRDSLRIYGKKPDQTVGERLSSARVGRGVTIILVCGHYTYQASHMFTENEMMYCRVHQEWFQVHSVTQFNKTVEVTPLLSRHELNGCTTKTGCTSRCKNQEVPPSVAALNNRAYGHEPRGNQGGLNGRRLA